MKTRTIGQCKERFMDKVLVIPDGCWEWQGANNGKSGYGRFYYNGKNRCAHRVSYELFVGEIPLNKTIDHICRNHLCVNPKHLRIMSQRENILIGVGIPAKNAIKTHCPNGHPYTKENTRIYKNQRYCRMCIRLASRRLKRRKLDITRKCTYYPRPSRQINAV